MTDDPETEIIHREGETDSGEPAAQVVNTIADIEDTDTNDLPPMWGCVDDILDSLYSTPPDPGAQMIIGFSYQSYRVTIEQD